MQNFAATARDISVPSWEAKLYGNVSKSEDLSKLKPSHLLYPKIINYANVNGTKLPEGYKGEFIAQFEGEFEVPFD